MLSSANSLSWGSDIPSLPQCLLLEPIAMDCQRYTRLGELRRVFGVSLGSTSEEHTFGATYLKTYLPVATEELKNFKDSVQDASRKARDRAKMLCESIFKLDKYLEALSSKKRQRNDSLSIESPGGSLSKNQFVRNPQEQSTPRYDDESQFAGSGLNKRIRRSMVNADGRSAIISRPQIIVENDRDLLKVSEEIQIAEKMRKLAGGEGWEKKLTRKRSVATAAHRNTNGEWELKKVVHPKMSPYAKLRTNDALGFRLGHEENSAEKTLRAQKLGSVITVDLSPRVRQSSETIESWELPSTQRGQALGFPNDNKRPLDITVLSANSVAHWGGQRPQKILRTKRSNVASPIGSSETHISSQSYMSSDQIAKFFSPETNKSSESDNPKFKIKLEKTSSPFGLSEVEESRDRENNLKEKRLGIAATAKLVNESFPFTSKKNIVVSKEESVNGGHSQGRMERFFPFSRPSGSFVLESAEIAPPTKKLQCMKRGPDKNRSKSGRPPIKNLKDRKVLTRTGPVLNSGKLLCTDGLNDDHEDLLVAANSARNASRVACSGLFWKEIEPLFASVSPKDLLYLKQQLSLAGNLSESLGQFFRDECNLPVDVKDKMVSDCSGQSGGKNFCSNYGSGCFSDGVNTGRRLDSVPRLYERLISALIDEDEIEEFYHQDEWRNVSFQSVSDDSHCGSCIDESEVDFQAQKPCILDRFSCNKSASSNTHSSNRSVSSSLCNSEQWQADDGLSSFDVGNTFRISHSDPYMPIPSPANASGGSVTDSQYQLMSLDERIALELQSVGLYPENVPELIEWETGLNQEITELQLCLLKNVGEAKKCLGKIDKEIDSSRVLEMRVIEQRAMDDLVVMAYRKITKTSRNSNSSRVMARRVPKEIALAFGKRALARCHKFEETGSSCFLEPQLKDILFSTTVTNKEILSIKSTSLAPPAVTNPFREAFNPKAAIGGSGTAAFSNVGKNDDYNSWGRQRGLLNNLASNDMMTNGEALTSSSARGGQKAKARPKPRRGGQRSGQTKRNHHPKEEDGTTNFGNGNFSLNELDSIDLGMNKDDLEGTQDLSSWLNFEGDGCFDHGDSSMGLDIPMDDLSELHMLM